MIVLRTMSPENAFVYEVYTLQRAIMLAKKQDQKNLFLKPPLLNLNYKNKNQFNFSKKEFKH